MPSGSHRTSGGSHSSGGSRASSGFSSSRSSSSRSSSGFSSSRSSSSRVGGSSTRSYHSGRHYHRGGGVYINGRQMGPIGTIIFYFVFLILFSGMWAVGGFVIGNQRQEELNKIKEDYAYYQNMITVAKQNNTPDEQYIITGTVTGKFLSDYANKWYLTYSFSGQGGATYNGETYAIYSRSDVANIIPNVTTIQLAADSPVITANTDTVNMDYENTTLNDDGYYLEAKKSLLFPQILCFVVAGGSAILFISLIVKSIKNLKSGESSNEKLTSNADKLGNENNTEQAAKQQKYCDYCCSEIPQGKSKCPNCGARKQ